jgi:hypothetical protein
MTDKLHRQMAKLKAIERWENEGGRIRTEESHSNAIYEMGPRHGSSAVRDRNDLSYPEYRRLGE